MKLKLKRDVYNFNALHQKSRSTINSLRLYLKKLEKKEEGKPKVNGRKEIKAGIYEIDTTQQKKINKDKLVKKSNKIDKLQASLIKQKQDKIQITNTQNEGGLITADPRDIRRKIREYHEQLYASNSTTQMK